MHPPLHRHPGYLVAVFVGGILGTALRYAGQRFIVPVGPWPLGTMIINLLGAFLLAVFLGAMLDLGELSRRQHALRLSIGTGVMGGFTTYSSLAVETATLLHDGPLAAAVLYPVTSMVAGLLVSLAGLRLVGITSARRRR